MPKAIQLSPDDTLKIILTTQEGKVSKRPHQAFLMVKDSQTSLETSYVFSVKESGKGKVEFVRDNVKIECFHPRANTRAHRPIKIYLINCLSHPARSLRQSQ